MQDYLDYNIVREKAKIILSNKGIKAMHGMGNFPYADFYQDARGLPDANGGGKPTTQSNEQWVSTQINVNAYLDIVLDAIHRIPARRWQKAEKWCEDPIRILFFCAFGIHRSMALKNIIASRLKELGYNVEVL